MARYRIACMARGEFEGKLPPEERSSYVNTMSAMAHILMDLMRSSASFGSSFLMRKYPERGDDIDAGCSLLVSGIAYCVAGYIFYEFFRLPLAPECSPDCASGRTNVAVPVEESVKRRWNSQGYKPIRE